MFEKGFFGLGIDNPDRRTIDRNTSGKHHPNLWGCIEDGVGDVIRFGRPKDIDEPGVRAVLHHRDDDIGCQHLAGEMDPTKHLEVAIR